MKSLMLTFVLVLGITKLWCLGSHGVCRGDRPQTTYHPAVHQVALATPAEGFELEPEREPAEGLPVPIYPGTRVTEAEIKPPHLIPADVIIARNPRVTEAEIKPPHPARSHAVDEPRMRTEKPQGEAANPLSMVVSQTITGRISATEARARDDARVQLQHQVTAWLAPDVPASWKPPAPLIDRLIGRTEIETVDKDYGTLYEATLHVDSSPARRAEILAAYQHERVVHRMGLMGGGLAAILTCLAAVAGYIRADEATKGYYTNWLRVAAAAGVGASGVLIYQLLA